MIAHQYSAPSNLKKILCTDNCCLKTAKILLLKKTSHFSNVFITIDTYNECCVRRRPRAPTLLNLRIPTLLSALLMENNYNNF